MKLARRSLESRRTGLAKDGVAMREGVRGGPRVVAVNEAEPLRVGERARGGDEIGQKTLSLVESRKVGQATARRLRGCGRGGKKPIGTGCQTKSVQTC